MNRLSKLLSLVLAAQLVFLAIAFWPQSSDTDAAAQAALLDVDADSITRIIVSDGENSVVLSKVDRGWALPEYHSLPADSDSMDALLQDLPALSRGWPVAQTEGAQQRFEVADDNYQRKVQFIDESETIATVYLGTAPGFKKVHARADGEDVIYAIAFNSFDLPAEQSQWLDQALLQLSDPQSIQGLDYQLDKHGETWNGNDGQVPQQNVVDSLVNGFQNLRVEGIVDIATAAILRDTKVPPTLTVTNDDTQYEYRLFEMEDVYYLNRADIDIYFNLSALDYDRLNDVNAASLYTTEATTSEELGQEETEPQ